MTPYRRDSDGHLVPEIPTQCALGAVDGTTCDIHKDFFRERSTGPGFPVMVAECKTHHTHFTLYPPGYGPYLRAPVVQLAPDGKAARAEDGKNVTGARIFEQTVFQAALDAKQRNAWDRDSQRGVPERWWNTQRRHLAFALALLGIAGGVEDDVRDQIAAALDVDPELIRQETRGELSGYQARGIAVWRVLRKAHRGGSLGLRLLLCGYLIGRWGEPWTWDPKRRTLERLPFLAGSPSAPT